MKNALRNTLIASAMGLAAASALHAETVVPGGDITVSTTWTRAASPYRLDGQVNIKGGATLTIEPGVIVRGIPGTGLPASGYGMLLIARGSKIYAVGTKDLPIVFTSTEDGSGMTLGGQRFDASSLAEWGNITICGNGLIGAEYIQTGASLRTYPLAGSTRINSPRPTGVNRSLMEGLNALGTDETPYYGGADDDDDSGSMAYVSLRYGGVTSAIANAELNGLALGGVGRDTDICYIDVFQNQDDGIEIWGGKVNLKYISIWYVGDDSFDVDQGWRGKVQNVLIVQGSSRSTGGSQGSGIGDNAFESDGAEANDSVPATTSTIYNVTVIGQPDNQGGAGRSGSDEATAWRDNARIQYRNCIFMDIGEQLIQEEPSEASTPDFVAESWRYGQIAGPFATTPEFSSVAGVGVWGMTYDTAYDATVDTSGEAADHPNNADYLSGEFGLTDPIGPVINGTVMTLAELSALYDSQSAGSSLIGQGFLCEITDSLFYNLDNTSAFTTGGGAAGSNEVGVTVAGDDAPLKANVVQNTGVDASSPLPIRKLTRLAPTNITGTIWMSRIAVNGLDPRRNTANTATVSAASAPMDGFFTPQAYRGAFSDTNNWCVGWTAAYEYGLFDLTGLVTPPTATIDLTSRVGFPTTMGVTYVVEESTDGVSWSPKAVVYGDGSTKYYADLGGLTTGKLYRAVVQ